MVSDQAESTYCGYAAIVGRPNAGKSTLMNVMLGVKVSAISPRPQTTRQGIHGIYTEENRQVVFVDTPGWHRPQDGLGVYMQKAIQGALDGVDLVLWTVDLHRGPNDEDRAVAQRLGEVPADTPVWIVGAKSDLCEEHDSMLNRYHELLPGAQNRYPVSALRNPKGVYLLRRRVLQMMPEGPFMYPDEYRSDQSREMWAAELVREQLMTAMHDELPYAAAVRVTQWTERPDGLQSIEAQVIVERESHKAMVIGKGGRMLKKIGTLARQELEVFLGQRVYLHVQVSVIPDWRRDPRALADLGYDA